MAPFSFLSRFGAHKASDPKGSASLLEDAEEASSGPRGIANKRHLSPRPPPTKADSGKLPEAKPTPPTPAILPLLLVLTSPSVSSLDLGVPLHPTPKTVSSPQISVAEGVLAGPSAPESKMTLPDKNGVEVKKIGLHLEAIGGGEVPTRSKDGVVGGLMMNAKKAFQSRNSGKASDLEEYRRHQFPDLLKRGDTNKSTDLESFLERLRLGDKGGKEVRSHEEYITVGSDDGEDEDTRHLTPSAPDDDLTKARDQEDYKSALGLEYKKARVLPVDDGDEEERAKRAFREMYYKKKALAHRQKAGLVGTDGGDDTHVGTTNGKEKPLSLQENAKEYVDVDDEWKPYVPEKDDDEWEFLYYMSLKPAKVWSPIDEY
ncbi:hypothetical protein V493_06431 [Pseudogymnoascus sp. VKM F-4281 (FW-2241)]|nr:hypothetical protein V493_06431 [Pseudogymnoascus sp. VKM F-4281 (FW-2241)]